LLFQHFEQMIARTAREHQPPAAILWRPMVKAWLRRQGLMFVR